MRKQISTILIGASLLGTPKQISLEDVTDVKNPKPEYLRGIVETEDLGLLTITSYRSTKQQCDSSPFFTSIGEHVHPGGVALSRDMLVRWGGKVHYGSTLLVEGLGFVRVNDCMAAKIHRHIDVWVATLKDEQSFQRRWKSGLVHVWLLKSGG